MHRCIRKLVTTVGLVTTLITFAVYDRLISHSSLKTYFRMNMLKEFNSHYVSKNADIFNTVSLTKNVLSGSSAQAMKHSVAVKSCKPQLECYQQPLQSMPSIKSIRNGTLKPSQKPRTIFLNTAGRLGNVLYQLAALLSLQKATCAKVIVSSQHKLSNIFEKVPFPVVSQKELKRLSNGTTYFNMPTKTAEYDAIIQTALEDSIQISAIFANFNLFAGCQDYIKDKLRLKSSYLAKARNTIDELIRQSGKQNVTTVGMHVRRGDLATKRYYDRGYRVPNETYFNKAMLYFKEKYKNVVFIVTTNDRKWVQMHFPRNRYSDVFEASSDNFLVDFAILIQCDFVLQSLGSFGHWAAYFNGRESVYFRDFLVCGSRENCHPEKYKPRKNSIVPGWIPMV